MASAVKFYSYTEALGKGLIDYSSDTFKIVATSTAPSASTWTTYSSISTAETTGGNGYTTGGLTVSGVTPSTSSGTYKVTMSNLVITATGGSIAAMRYFVLMDDTDSTKPLICYWDYGSTLNLAVGESVTITFNATTGVIQIA
jgi:hypothetical protein